METTKEYRQYRNQILLKATGANIHKVNGILGKILSHTNNAAFYKDKDKKKYEKHLEEIRKQKIEMGKGLK